MIMVRGLNVAKVFLAQKAGQGVQGKEIGVTRINLQPSVTVQFCC